MDKDTFDQQYDELVHGQIEKFGHHNIAEDRLETLVNELVAERVPVIEAEKAKRARISEIVEKAKFASKTAIDAYKRERGLINEAPIITRGEV